MFPISPMAQSYLRTRAKDSMLSTCRIERVTKPQVMSDLRAVAGSKTVIYEGICRIRDANNTNIVVIGDTDVDYQNTYISIPWDIYPVPLKDDEIVMLTSPEEPMYLDKRFMIESMAKGGLLRPTRLFQVKMLQEKRP